MGIFVGSYLFAEASGYLSRTVEKWGDKGKLTLPDVFRVSSRTAIFVLVPLLIVALMVLEKTTVR